MSALTQSRLKEVLDYCPSNGIFKWKKQLSRNVPTGTRAGWERRGYIRIGVDGQTYMAHRLAWLYIHGSWPCEMLDHIDNIGTHNWISNLREATRSQNCANSKIRNGKPKGVYFNKERNKWQAQIQYNNKMIYLGRFDNISDGHIAYMQAAQELHGEFARFA